MTEAKLKTMTYAEFEQWLTAQKAIFHARCDQSFKDDCSPYATLLNRYQDWSEWFAGELTGYSSTETTNKPTSILFFGTNDRPHTMTKAIAHAKAAYTERTQRLQSKLALAMA
jgi:hypothetical protein